MNILGKQRWSALIRLVLFSEVSEKLIRCKNIPEMTEQSTVLPTTFMSVPVMPVSHSIASHPTGISSTASALLSAPASSSPSPVIRTIRLASSSPAASPPAFPHNVLAPPSSPFTSRFPATSTQQQLGTTSVSVDSSGFATRFLMANPVASQIGQARYTIVTSSLSTPTVQPAYVQAMVHNTSSTISGTPSYFSELFAPRHSNPGRLAPGEVFPVNEQYNIVQPGIQSAQFPTPSLEFSPFFGGPRNFADIGKLVSAVVSGNFVDLTALVEEPTEREPPSFSLLADQLVVRPAKKRK